MPTSVLHHLRSRSGRARHHEVDYAWIILLNDDGGEQDWNALQKMGIALMAMARSGASCNSP